MLSSKAQAQKGTNAFTWTLVPGVFKSLSLKSMSELLSGKTKV